MSDEARQNILRACYRVLLPLARVLLSCGIGYREFVDVCRHAFVKTASTEFGVRGRETNASRVSAMTGIPRKQVQDIRREWVYEASEPKKVLSPLADLLHIWATSEQFVNDNGKPKELSVSDDATESFDVLVSRCMGDVPPGAVKAELLRLGAISISSENKLALKRRSLIPDDLDSRLESALVYSLRGLADTIAYNSDPRTKESDRRFERFVESQPLTESDATQLKEIVRIRLTQLSEELDLLLNSEGPAVPGEAGRRIGIGLYFSE